MVKGVSETLFSLLLWKDFIICLERLRRGIGSGASRIIGGKVGVLPTEYLRMPLGAKSKFNVSKKLDSIRRNFFWEGNSHKKKFHQKFAAEELERGNSTQVCERRKMDLNGSYRISLEINQKSFASAQGEIFNQNRGKL
ncbi:hypothetical protein MTR67_008042 [Solanum verrucosum]|uniref:Uncharacterized protein n=1 Tax=Solanum verrucosum TaxID=315347 RepID=A0AAF0Q1E1_SOLVR|nr:hypothetical protein MTR67_008042 [Solanum verrucosum]